MMVGKSMRTQTLLSSPVMVRTRRNGFSMIEAMTAVALVGIACTAMLLSVSQAIQSSDSNQGVNRANGIAQDLMNEISACRWSDSQSPQHWGPESGEVVSASRAGFNDLDDYDRWSGSPQIKSGLSFDTMQHYLFPSVRSDEYAHYSCSVQVEYVVLQGNAAQHSNSSTPYRMVTVRVTHADHAPVEIRRVFADISPLLARTYWYNPATVESDATVTVVANASAPSSPIETIVENVVSQILKLGGH
jgi:type II secretory pathway pseudopilin PulG